MDLKQRMKRWIKPAAVAGGWIFLGILIGGHLFSDTQPRSLIGLNRCHECWKFNQLSGVITSVAIQKYPQWIPEVVLETDLVIAVKHPHMIPERPKHHYVVFPKRDIRDEGDLREGDEKYLIAMHAALSHLIREHDLERYQVWSNGPDIQLINYIHYHVMEF